MKTTRIIAQLPVFAAKIQLGTPVKNGLGGPKIGKIVGGWPNETGDGFLVDIELDTPINIGMHEGHISLSVLNHKEDFTRPLMLDRGVGGVLCFGPEEWGKQPAGHAICAQCHVSDRCEPVQTPDGRERVICERCYRAAVELQAEQEASGA